MNAPAQIRRLPEPPPITSAQLHALDWLACNGGHAMPDRYGRLIATNGARSHHQAVTFLRLFVRGLVTRSFLDGHLGITQEGLEALK